MGEKKTTKKKKNVDSNKDSSSVFNESPGTYIYLGKIKTYLGKIKTYFGGGKTTDMNGLIPIYTWGKKDNKIKEKCR